MLSPLKFLSKRYPFLRHQQVLPVRSITISQTAAGVTVATFQEQGLTAGLSVIVGGGSRYETEKTAGAAHYLKNYTFMVRTL
jgi:predicted Zn-dependent peptidase